jgi:hypothetical protein
MDARTTEIMGFDPQLLQMPLTAGEAVGRWLKQHHPINTAKLVARDVGVDLRTAENLLRGHLSALTFTKVVKVYGWPFLAAVGAATIGETYDQFIASEIEAVERAKQRLEEDQARMRARYEALRAHRAQGSARLRLVDAEDRRGA